MVCAYFGLVNPSPGFFWLAATVEGGGDHVFSEFCQQGMALSLIHI